MKKISFLALAASLATFGSAQGLVSAFDFNGTLEKFYDRDGFAGSLDFRSGRTTNSTVAAGPNYSTQTVGGVTKQVAQFSDTTNQEQFFRATHGMGSNGGGAFVNQYSILMDVKITSSGDWVSFYNTNANNQNDGDAFIRNSDNGLGISGDYSGSFVRNEWNRVIITSSTPGAGMNIFVNGVLANQINLDGLDGRWSLYSRTSSTPVVDIFADNDGDSGSGFISQLAFYDKALTATEVTALGSAGAAVPEPATLMVLGLGMLAVRRRRQS